MSDNNLFEEYMEEKPKGVSSLLKTPKGWLILFTAVLIAVLAALFYKSAVLDTMSGEEVRESIKVTQIEALWMDKEVTPQEVKIVPAVRMKIQNVGKSSLQYMDIQAVFVLEEDGIAFSDGMVRIFREPLEPQAISDEIVIKALFGYTATSKAAFLDNKKEWKKVQAKVFVRAKGSELVRISEIIPVKQVIDGFNPETVTADGKPIEYQDEATAKLAHSLQIVQQDSLWVDKIETAKEVIIVPSVSISVKNMSEAPLKDLVFKGVFIYEETGEILSEGISPAIRKPLPAGETSKLITMRADFGYSATSKEAFFKNNQKWKQLKVKVYTKSTNTGYALLGTYPIKQKIEGIKVVYH
jgi:hypothetical protein